VEKLRQVMQGITAARARVLPEREPGQTNVEYALILFLIAVVAASVLAVMGEKIKSVLESVNSYL
jgi:Flp pilus assembly pilin Flp